MAAEKAKTNKLLLLLSLLACPGIGFLTTQTSHIPSSIAPVNVSFHLPQWIGSSGESKTASTAQDQTTVLDPAVLTPAVHTPTAPASESASAADTVVQESPAASSAPVTGTATGSDVAAASSSSAFVRSLSAPYVSFRAAKSAASSAEASAGSWSKGENAWYYMVNGQAFHGWLNDTDGRIYYFDPSSGEMATGWKDIDGKQYYFSADGVLQCGQILIDGAYYEFDETGVLVSTPPAPAPAQDAPPQE